MVAVTVMVMHAVVCLIEAASIRLNQAQALFPRKVDHGQPQTFIARSHLIGQSQHLAALRRFPACGTKASLKAGVACLRIHGKWRGSGSLVKPEVQRYPRAFL